MKNMKNNMTRIGLKTEESARTAIELNLLLANYQVFYLNTRGYHWNIKGNSFFELHGKFEELYTNLQAKIDEIAERILTLGHTPTHSYSEYMSLAAVKEATNVSDGKEAVIGILEALKILVQKERTILSLSAASDDEGTNALMSDYIREQEKLVWMYSAYLG